MSDARNDDAPISRAELRRVIQAATDYVGELMVYATAATVTDDKQLIAAQSESVKAAGDKLQSLIGPLEGISDHA